MDNKDKLPKWAQYDITLLERKIEQLQSIVDSFNNADTSISYGYSVKHGLPDHTTVQFVVDGVRFDVSISNGLLKIYSTDTIAVIPNAANTVSIKSGER